MTELSQFNAFGLVKVTRYEVSVSLTAVTTDGKAIVRDLLQELGPDQQLIGEGEYATALIGVFIEPKRSRIAFHDMIQLPGIPEVGELPGVSKAVAEVVKQIRKVLEEANSEGISL